MKFQVLRGSHQIMHNVGTIGQPEIKCTRFEMGDILETDIDLAKRHNKGRRRFQRVPDNTPVFSSVSTLADGTPPKPKLTRERAKELVDQDETIVDPLPPEAFKPKDTDDLESLEGGEDSTEDNDLENEDTEDEEISDVFSDYTVKDLKAVAKEHDITLPQGANKSQILAVIRRETTE